LKCLQNKLFCNNQSRFYDSLDKIDDHHPDLPSREGLRSFWSGIWEVPVQYNKDASWIRSAIPSKRTAMNTCKISEEHFLAAIKKVPNWKSPGIDCIHGYWLKHFSALHHDFLCYFNQLICLDAPIYPSLLARRTSLIMKDKSKGAIPSNYRPITCLSTIWKLLSRIIHRMILSHLEANELIPFEQMGCASNSRATKDQLLIDKLRF